MKVLLFILSMCVVSNVFASPVCDFPYDLDETAGVRELDWKPITAQTRLTQLQSLQVIEAAKRLLKDAGASVPRRMNLRKAVEVLSRDSEGGDVSMMIFRFQGKVYTLVQYYPGGNSYGYVFKGLEVVARRADGDLLCDGL